MLASTARSPPPLQIITLAGIRWLDVQVVECISVLKYLVITKIGVVIIPPANEVAGVYSDPYVRPFVRSFVRSSVPPNL